MNCKYCNGELEEGISVCPACGKDNLPEEETPVAEAVSEEEAVSAETAEEAPAEKKRSLWKLILAIAGGVVLLAAIVTVIVVAIQGGFKPRENNISYKDSYTVKDSKVEKGADDVVAVVGDMELTNGDLQIHYWMNVYDFLDSYSYYLSMFGLDYTKPLDEQYYSEDDGITWQQYFLQNALDSWHRYAALNIVGKEEGYEMSEELKKALETLPENLEKTATGNGFKSAEEMLRADMGAGCSIEDYIRFMELSYYGNEYYTSVCEEASPTEDQIEEYFEKNKETIEKAGYGKEAGNQVDVRHVLIQPEGGTKGDDGKTTYSDDEWEACRAEAQKLLDEWLAGEHTEDTFAQLAKDHSADSNASSGGLYQGINSETNFVEEFLDWCMDESRQVGDYGLVKTTYGYHIMYFSATEEMWYAYSRDAYMADIGNTMLSEAIKKYTMEVTYKDIVLGDVSLTSAS